MKTKHIFSFFFSLLFLCSQAQSVTVDTVAVQKKHWQPNFVVGADLLNLGISFFGERKLYRAFATSQIKDQLHAAADVGFEKNTYKKNGYDAEASGPFLKLGAFYMLVRDPEDSFSGFYLGGKLGASSYSQEYHAVPVKGYAGNSSTVAFPVSRQFSGWVEATAGGRVRLFKSNAYIDVNLQPGYLLFSTKQDRLKPMIVPGFGRSSGGFNFGFSWGLGYRF